MFILIYITVSIDIPIYRSIYMSIDLVIYRSIYLSIYIVCICLYTLYIYIQVYIPVYIQVYIHFYINIFILAEFSFQRGEYVTLACKSYLAYDDEKEQQKRSSKGIPHSINLELKAYKDTLYQIGERHEIEFQSLRLSKEKKMARYKLLKKGLSDLFYKMHVDEDRITCSPLKMGDEYL